ncbi:APC family permease [Brachybacterium paraconglomeratum]|uniref:APC family permease n=1 Tax=Brachybacterium paraconglomeratum TaxID=173362 RepID=UPI003825FE14
MRLYQGFPAEVSPFAAIAVMVAFAPWAFVGFDNVPQAAGEFDFSPKKAMGLIVAAIFASGAIYLTIVLVTSVAASHAGGSLDGSVGATADAITAMLGPVGRALVVIAVFMGVITGLNAFTVSASRILMAMGRARMLPPVLGRVSHRFGTPVVAVAAAILIASPSPFFGRSALLWIVDMTSVGVTVAYFVTCLVAFEIAEKDGWSPGKTKLAKVIAIVGAVLSVGFLLLLIVPDSPGALATDPLIALAAWVVMGIVFFVLRKPTVDEMPEKELEQAILEG